VPTTRTALRDESTPGAQHRGQVAAQGIEHLLVPDQVKALKQGRAPTGHRVRVDAFPVEHHRAML